MSGHGPVGHRFSPSLDPRNNGRCACGRPAEDHPDGLAAVADAPETDAVGPPARNVEWEAEMYRTLERIVVQRHGVSPAALLELTRRRMGTIGAADYGDASFLTDDRDLVAELSDEQADSIAYVVMQLQKLMYQGVERPDVVSALFESAVHACIADNYARMARRALMGR